MSYKYQDDLLISFLQTSFPEISSQTIEVLRQHTEWVEIAAGQTLMQQGDIGDSMYLAISGRLRAYVTDSDGVERIVGELTRGQVIGEMSMYTDDPRSATVVATRNSVLVRLAKSNFNDLLTTSPEVSISLTRQIINRLRDTQLRPVLSRPVTICLMPITAEVDVQELAHSLARAMQPKGRVRVVDAASIDEYLGQTGAARSLLGTTEVNRKIALYLDQIEAANEYVLLIADDQPTPWTHRCCQSSDEILLIANALQPAELHTNERECLMTRTGRAEAIETLILLHPQDLRSPRGTRDWLDRRPVTGHIHIRPALQRDMARLARIQSCTAVGLVMAGGGARGIAHLGLLKALQEKGIEVDYVGGTSIGSVMAMVAASDLPLAEATQIARTAFKINPTGDFNFMPLLSLIAGRRLQQVISSAVNHLLGHDGDIEDLWKNYYCVATNYSQAREQVVRRGRLAQAVMASIAIPGALPPVLHDGDLLCDGGTFNNFPVNVMRASRNVGKVIGADLNFKKPKRIELEQVPGNWALFRDRLRPRKQRQFRFPSLLNYLINVTVLYSVSRQQHARKATDLYFNPPLDRVGLLEWKKFDDILHQGYEHGNQILKALEPAALRELR